MKNNKLQILFILLLSALALLFSSCDDVINVDLNSASPQIVIEANITDQFANQVIKVSLTKNFNENNNIVPVHNALVTVQEENGTKYTFTENNNDGQYFSTKFYGKSGVRYTVQVISSNKTYTAQSIMPNRVQLDSLSLTSLTFFGKEQKFIEVNYNDPSSNSNYYNYVMTVNDVVRNAYYPEEDRFNNGKKVTSTIFNSDPALKTGDKVTLDFQCINQKIYKW